MLLSILRLNRSQVFLRCSLALALCQPASVFASFFSDHGTSRSPLLEPDESARAREPQAVLDLPFSFEKNLGQASPEVKYLSRGKGYTLYLTPAEMVLVLGKTGPNRKDPKGAKKGSGPGPRIRDREILRMRLVGGNRLCRVNGEGELPGKSNYLMGKDPSRWRRNVPHFSTVRLEEVYPGVDLVYYGNAKGRLEYDFIVKPGADPSVIRMKFAGMRELRPSGKGGLELRLKAGSLSLDPPVLYQEEGGRRGNVEGRFARIGPFEAGFRVGTFDPKRSLVIDPVLAYSTYLGGTTSSDYGSDIAVDAAGNAYVTGLANSADFPTTAGVFQGTYAGGVWDLFVTKLNPAGSALVYSTYLGGIGEDLSWGIALDGGGNVYVAGTTYSTDFPTTPGAFQTTGAVGGMADAIVTKLDPTGTTLVYSTYLGGNSGEEYSGRIAVDGAGNAFVTGTTTSSNFPITPGAFQTVNGSTTSGNVFVTKVNPAGSALVYSTFLGGSAGDTGFGITLDGAGNAYVTGMASSSDFPTTPGAFQTALSATNSTFVAKMNPAGSGLVYSTFLGGTTFEWGYGVDVDGGGNAYVIGSTRSPDFPTTPGSFQPIIGGGSAGTGFITKLNPVGSGLVYSSFIGGTAYEEAYGVKVDGSGVAHLVGFTYSPDFPITLDAYQSAYTGTSAVFYSQVDPTGSSLVYSTYLGGTEWDMGISVDLDGMGGVYLTGSASSLDFPTTAGAFQGSLPGGFGSNAAIVAKFLLTTPTATPTVTSTPTATRTPTPAITPTSTPTSTRTPTSVPTCHVAVDLPQNIFQPSTQGSLPIPFTYCFPGNCSLKVFNSAGEQVRVLRDVPNQPAGADQVDWDGKNQKGEDLASGVYLVRLVTQFQVLTAKVVIVR